MVIYSRIVTLFVCGLCTFAPATKSSSQDSDEYYRLIDISVAKTLSSSRSKNWKPAPEGLALEVSGLAFVDNDRLAVAIRKGEVWTLEGVYNDPPSNVIYKRFATALHEPLGLLFHDGDLLTAQRSELTRLRDTDHDGVADEYLTAAKGWGVTGHYHEYAYGPELDNDGNLWITLNIGMGLKGDQLSHIVRDAPFGYRQGRWRGWAMKLSPDGKLKPSCAGMRSPAGIGRNADGDMFYTDQQGNWVATNSLHHLRDGVFFHHAQALASMNLDGSTIHDVKAVPNKLPLPKALKLFPQLVPPAVWFPYKKVGQSATDIMLDASDGKFGPFSGQFFVGEFTQAGMNRVFLEKVNDQYQGACFPFRLGFASAVLRMIQGKDGSMFVGLTNRGWSSLGRASYGLQRLVWTGKTPFEIKEMRAAPDGFDLVFTQPVDTATASNPDSYSMKSYTYNYQSAYGSDEIQTKQLAITAAKVSSDRMSVSLTIENLRRHHVHELTANGVKNEKQQPLVHDKAYYTLNHIPQRKQENHTQRPSQPLE